TQPKTATTARLTPFPVITPTLRSVDVAPYCLSDAPALPMGVLPVTSRSPDSPAHNGLVAIAGDLNFSSGFALVDPTTGSLDVLTVAVGGKTETTDLFVNGWSADGRWLAVRYGTQGPCGTELIVSADGTRALAVGSTTRAGLGLAGATWSPDGRWLAI